MWTLPQRNLLGSERGADGLSSPRNGNRDSNRADDKIVRATLATWAAAHTGSWWAGSSGNSSALKRWQEVGAVLGRCLYLGDIEQRPYRDVCPDERRQIHDRLVAPQRFGFLERRIAHKVLAAQLGREIVSDGLFRSHILRALADAQVCYQQALRLNPLYADAHFYLAVTFEKMALSQEARAHWRAYQQLAPNGEWVELAKEFSDS